MRVTDAIPGVTLSGGPIPSLAPGASDNSTFTGTYTLTQADINAGSFTNTATVTANTPSGATVTDTDDDIQSFTSTPGLTITKSASPTTYSAAGTMITYTIVVQNTSNVTITNISVTDPLTSLSQTIASLAPGQSRNITATYRIVQNDLNRGFVDNTARATFTFRGTPYSETASARITANIGPDISITKSARETRLFSSW